HHRVRRQTQNLLMESRATLHHVQMSQRHISRQMRCSRTTTHRTLKRLKAQGDLSMVRVTRKVPGSYYEGIADQKGFLGQWGCQYFKGNNRLWFINAPSLYRPLRDHRGPRSR